MRAAYTLVSLFVALAVAALTLPIVAQGRSAPAESVPLRAAAPPAERACADAETKLPPGLAPYPCS